MNARNKNHISYLLVLVAIIVSFAATSLAAEYDSLKGIQAVKAVFDYRVGDPEIAVSQLDLIHKTFKDQNLTSLSKKPEIAVIFMGPAVRLVTTDRQGYSPEDQRDMDAIAATLSKMARDGIKLEICMHAAKQKRVDPATILPVVKKVGNGWISVIGYQQNGYALVSNF